jgi:DNA polymerase III alpha subunit
MQEIQPILGLEIDLETGRLPLLATSLEGWSNLCRLSSALALQDDPDLPCSLDLLSQYTGDLIALASDETSLGALKEIFPKRLYLTLTNPARGLPRTDWPGNSACRWCHPPGLLPVTRTGRLTAHTGSAIRLVQPLAKLPPDAIAPPGAYFTSAAEMEMRFAALPESHPGHTGNRRTLPVRPALGRAAHAGHSPADGKSASPGAARARRIRGQKLYGQVTPEIQARLDNEIEVIARMGYEPIFLIVEDILNFARQTGVPYSSRGSAASSLVAHCLGITSPDPLRLNLYFERFLNPARVTPPDIDTDLCSIRRDSVIQHVFDTYGAERVAMVATINRFRPRSALGDVAKAHGLEPAQVREMVNRLPHSFWARLKSAMPKAGISPFAELRQSTRLMDKYSTKPKPF